MKKLSLILVLAASAVTAAEASEGLAAKYACVACHQASTKVVGPPWKDIAAKYVDGSTTALQLAESIKRGGSGKWGAIPMPPQPAVSDADARELASWILGQKEQKR
ncbi:c-type cytochrome [Variovorax paradoxus]|nr:c-type cytochrome [Variovorax paradoxus]